MSNVVIKEVKTQRERKLFADVPNIMYGDNPNYVPAFFSDDVDDWNPKKNPAFDYCEAKAYLAYRDGKIVGRIGAILSHKSNEIWNTERMRFSSVDFIDDTEVSEALFATVEAWAKEKGCTQVHGPLGFCDMDREGMLVEGFDRESMFITYYNAPYYKDHLERLGYAKDVDWIEFRLKTPQADSKEAKMMFRASERLQRQGKYHFAELKRRRDYKPYLKQVFGLLNESYAHLYGVVPLTDKQVEKYAGKFIPLVKPAYTTFIMNEREEMVALGITVPSLAKALKRSRGRLFPFGFVRVLRALRKNDAVDMLLIAVKPELQGLPIIAMIFDKTLKNAYKNGILYGETGPQLETNVKIQSQWHFFEKEQHKRRRCFVKDI